MRHLALAALAPPLVAVLSSVALVAQSAESVLALGGHDPVELTAGREVAGDAALTLEHGRYRYRFATEENRARFATDPARLGIQFGGGCGRMGPLSGVGDPARYAVHEGRIYVFASESCRTGFLADPAGHIDRADPVPTGDAAAAGRARELLERAARAAGSSTVIDKLESLYFRRDDARKGGDSTTLTGQSRTIAFPDAIRTEAWWGDWHRVDVVIGGGGFVRERTADGTGSWAHDPSQLRSVRRNWQREPLAILRARSREDFVAFAGDASQIGERTVVDVDCAYDGTTTRLAIDPDSGRVLRVAWFGRAGATPLGDVVVELSDFRKAGELELPFTRRVTFDGRTAEAETWTSVVVDPALEPGLFERAADGTPLVPEQSVKPGVNQSFLSDAGNVDSFTRRFEVESREVFVTRHRITAALGLSTGDAIADIGAGTGLFLKLFADAVGEDGKLYAVDIAPKFVTHLRDRAAKSNLPQVEAVQCDAKSANLPDDSVDVAFVCDTYHHFEFPQATLASIHRALRPGGRLVIVDFERIPGTSRAWILNHVRAGKEVVIAEIEAAGFELDEQIEVRGLRENYALRFTRQ